MGGAGERAHGDKTAGFSRFNGGVVEAEAVARLVRGIGAPIHRRRVRDGEAQQPAIDLGQHPLRLPCKGDACELAGEPRALQGPAHHIGHGGQTVLSRKPAERDGARGDDRFRQRRRKSVKTGKSQHGEGVLPVAAEAAMFFRDEERREARVLQRRP